MGEARVACDLDAREAGLILLALSLALITGPVLTAILFPAIPVARGPVLSGLGGLAFALVLLGSVASAGTLANSS